MQNVARFPLQAAPAGGPSSAPAVMYNPPALSGWVQTKHRFARRTPEMTSAEARAIRCEDCGITVGEVMDCCTLPVEQGSGARRSRPDV